MPSDATEPAVEPVLSTVTRSGRIESWHRGSLAIAVAGEVVFTLGRPEQPVYCRSAVKPLQALPLFERGLVERHGLDDRDLAVICASHDGTPLHVAAVERLLARAGLAPDALGCGPHAPLDGEARRALLQAGAEPTRLHNNCSGKHSGFLLLARDLGEPPADYLAPAGRTQQAVGAAVAAMMGLPAPLPTGLDGCGAPTFFAGLDALARAFSRLANPTGLSPVLATACRRILQAVHREPVLLAGERRFCTRLQQHSPRPLFGKNGAEGVYALALSPGPGCPHGLGIAIKVSDGAERGYLPVLLDLLQHLDWFGGPIPPALQPFHKAVIRNTNQVPVGEVRGAVDWRGWR